MPRVRLESVWVDYRTPRRHRRRLQPRIWALQDVSLKLRPGDRLGVIGGNGSGKTTLLRTVSGVFVPTSGRAEAGGRIASVVDLTPGPQRDLNGHENLQIDAVLQGLDRAELAERYDDILELAAIPDEILEQPLYTYSNGMMLRLRLALAIACEPDLLVVDEVLAVADARFQERYFERIDALCHRGTILVLASHNLETIAAQTDRTVVLEAGRVVLDGPSEVAVARYERAISDTGLLDGGAPPAEAADLPSSSPPQGQSLAERLARIGS